MSNDVFRELAEHLDALPQGFPKTESGVELRLLRKVFTEGEAEVASRMKLVPETPEQVAGRLGRDAGEMAELLESMTSRGQLVAVGREGARRYMALPFLVGIHEFQLARIDKEYVELFEEYFEEALASELAEGRLPQARVYPVEKAVPGDLTILPFERVSGMIEQAKAWAVLDCICRKEMEILDKGCGATMNNCLAFASTPHGFDIEYRGARKISKEEALGLLKKASEEGLVHNSWNIQDKRVFICNCCSCCCALLRGIKLSNSPHFLASSNYYADINPGTCIACGICADQRCPVGAINARGESYKVNRERCIGCGVCVVTCPSGSLSLQRKSEDEIDIPPKDISEWSMKRAKNTGRTMEGLF